jgi:conjugative transposon TraK protein
MFRETKNIDSAFRYIRLFSTAILCGVLLLCGFVIYKSYNLVGSSQQKIYVLVNGKALEAYASDRKDNVAVEAKDHIKVFHQLFFTLSPDDKVINGNISRSLYLADISAKREYDNLKENSYYSNIISSNVNQTIKIDSVHLELNQYPFYFKCYAVEQITRTTSIVNRSLVTEGYLRNVSRSDNNAHGFLIERWKILENKDLSVEKR